ncbi:MAG: amino acid ABC transporter permease [Actinomycetota bacterium]|nr:amino acid ABC transporter permease [Actinomycetota bacterium]
MGFIVTNFEWFWADNWRYAKYLSLGFLSNLSLALVAMVLALVFGLVLALLRISKNRLVSMPTGFWIDAWRNLPLIFIMLYLALAIPGSWREVYLDIIPSWLPDAYQTPFAFAAILALTLYNSAVIAEVMRAGIQSLERGQGEAAAAIGLPYWKAMRLVVLPQGLRRMVPATVSQLITLMKDTSLVSIIGVQEVVRRARITTSTSGSPFTGIGVDAPLLAVFVTVGLMFIIFNLALSRLSTILEVRERKLTGVTVGVATGLEDQVAAQADADDFTRTPA